LRIPDSGPRQFEGVHVGWPVFINFQEPTNMHTMTSSSPTILRRLQVQQRTGLSRSSLYQYVKEGAFPASVQLGPRAVGWLESDVSDWISSRVKRARQGNVSASR
jgi:prophage regulatory protein